MYLPKHFEETRPAALLDLIRAHPLATLICNGASGLLANHVPLLVDDGLSLLRGHVARANPLWQEIGAGVPALAIFQGADGYVSPSLYPSKARHGQVVPTWNYAVVHLRGQLRAVDDVVFVREVVETLTARHEDGRAQVWQLADAPAAYAERMLAAVVGIELRVEAVTGKFKLSQNRDVADRTGVLCGIANSELGDLMARIEAERSPS